MNEQAIQHLLDHVNSINEKYDGIAKITGEKFNIFSILRKENEEVGLHSRFIGELLNPKGIHGQGVIFLTLFTETLGINQYQENQLCNAQVIIEEYIGKKQDDKPNGGRIDIVVKPVNGGKKILIENKIDATDQPQQLIRYCNHYPDSHIFYLSPYGKLPSDLSVGKEREQRHLVHGTDFQCISYRDNIKKWLESCLKETTNFPLLRETLQQYIYLIKKLTNQATNKKMEKEIFGMITKNATNFESANTIAGNFESAKNELLETFWIEVKAQLENKLNLSKNEIFYTPPKISDRCPALFINTKIENAWVGIQPLNGKEYNPNYNRLFIGICDKNNKFKDNDNNHYLPEWRICKNFEYQNAKLDFDNIDTLKLILPDSKNREDIKKVIVEFAEDYVNDPEVVSKYFADNI